MTDEQSHYELVFPFVVCRSKGGPYEDESFVAGYQAGRIDAALKVASAVGATDARFTIYTPLVAQLHLIAMHYGFGFVDATECDGVPEWSDVKVSVNRPTEETRDE